MNRWKKKQATASTRPNKRPKLAGEGFSGRLGYFCARALARLERAGAIVEQNPEMFSE